MTKSEAYCTECDEWYNWDEKKKCPECGSL